MDAGGGFGGTFGLNYILFGLHGAGGLDVLLCCFVPRVLGLRGFGSSEG